MTVSSHFYPDFGLCKCRKHCQDFREDEVEVEERNFEMGGESSEEEIPEEIIDFQGGQFNRQIEISIEFSIDFC